MNKTNIAVVTIGNLPVDFKRQKIKKWSSLLFKINGDIESYFLPEDSDGEDWEFTDNSLERLLPSKFVGDFMIALVNVPLELNWYSRRISENRVVFTFHEIMDILKTNNIPIENVVYRLLYEYTFVYRRHKNRIPLSTEDTNFTHDETRGCIFDMNGIKTDIIHSCHNPIVCPDCVERLKQEKVSKEAIETAQKEIKKIRKPLYYRITDFIRKHPMLSLLISSIIAIALSALGSILGAYIYDKLKIAA